MADKLHRYRDPDNFGMTIEAAVGGRYLGNVTTHEFSMTNGHLTLDGRSLRPADFPTTYQAARQLAAKMVAELMKARND